MKILLVAGIYLAGAVFLGSLLGKWLGRISNDLR